MCVYVWSALQFGILVNRVEVDEQQPSLRSFEITQLNDKAFYILLCGMYIENANQKFFPLHSIR